MKSKITKAAVDKTYSNGKDAYLWDSELTGFGLKVTPAGRKVYLVQYRIGGRDGRSRRVTIGTTKDFTPVQARKKAKELLGQVANSVDPAETKTLERRKAKLRDHLTQFYNEYALRTLKPNTLDNYERVIRLYIPDSLKNKKTADITLSQMKQLHRSMKSNPYGANKTISILSKFFNWCEEEQFRPPNSNPCKGIKKYKEKSHDTFLSAREQLRLGRALSTAEKMQGFNPYAVAAIRLLATTGARKSEILTLRWDWVDFENKMLHLPDSKTGKKSIYLNAPSLQVLSEIPRQSGNPFVIVGGKDRQHLVNLQKPWNRIRKAALLPNVRIHDLRHTFASVAVMGGMSLPMIGALLGHKHTRTTQRYAHLAGDPLHAAAESIGSKMQIGESSKLAVANEK